MKKLLLSLVFALTSAASFAADIAILDGGVLPSSAARIRRGIAGPDGVSAGQLVRFSTSNDWRPTDANLSLSGSDVDGMAVHAASAGQVLTIVVADPALVLKTSAQLSKGVALIASATPGGIAPAADLTTGWYLTVCGLCAHYALVGGVHTSTISFNSEVFRVTTAQ